MKKFLFLIATILSIYSTPVYAADQECITMAQEDFINVTKSSVQKGVYATPQELKVFLEAVNTIRANNGILLIEADTLYVAHLVDDSIGLVAFKDGCVVPGMAWHYGYGKMFAVLKALNSQYILKHLVEPS